MPIKRPLSNQPLPKAARRVFKGVLFDVYQWQQKMYDGSKKTFEKIQRADTVTILPVTKEGKIVIGKQTQPGTKSFYSSFGGILEKGEDPLICAKRELMEETGMVAEKFILWESVQIIEKIDWAIYIFIAKNCKTISKQNLDNGEKINLLYLNFEQFLKIIKREDYRDSEIALKIFRFMHDKKKLKQFKQLLFS